jgi:hypothetical protein
MSWCPTTRTVIGGRSNTWRRFTPTSDASTTSTPGPVHRSRRRPVTLWCRCRADVEVCGLGDHLARDRLRAPPRGTVRVPTTSRTGRLLPATIWVVWAVFGVDFPVKLWLAPPHRLQFLRSTTPARAAAARAAVPQLPAAAPAQPGTTPPPARSPRPTEPHEPAVNCSAAACGSSAGSSRSPSSPSPELDDPA